MAIRWLDISGNRRREKEEGRDRVSHSECVDPRKMQSLSQSWQSWNTLIVHTGQISGGLYSVTRLLGEWFNLGAAWSLVLMYYQAQIWLWRCYSMASCIFLIKKLFWWWWILKVHVHFFCNSFISYNIHCVYGVSMTRKQDSGKRGRPTTTTLPWPYWQSIAS